MTLTRKTKHFFIGHNIKVLNLLNEQRSDYLCFIRHKNYLTTVFFGKTEHFFKKQGQKHWILIFFIHICGRQWKFIAGHYTPYRFICTSKVKRQLKNKQNIFRTITYGREQEERLERE